VIDEPAPETTASRSPWWWTPSLYFAQALPFVFVTTVSTYPYTRLGVSAVVIGYLSWLALPWTFKPLWSPLVELIGNERRWILGTQFAAGAAFLFVAFGYGREHFLVWTVIGYSALAFISATHDIAADGFYMRALSSHEQTWFAGIRGVAFRGGWMFTEGALVALAGVLMRREFSPQTAWSATHAVAAALFFAMAVYHAFALPRPASVGRAAIAPAGGVGRETVAIFRKFLAAMPAAAIAYLLLYRFAEAQLGKFAGKFLLDPRDAGGLGLLEEQIGLINGTFGIAALLAGGVLGGWAAARFGLRRCLWPMAVLINVPNAVYVALAYWQPTSLVAIGAGVVIEKLGYGFGFAGYMLYMLYLSRGEHRTSFYAMCTGLMALGLIVPASLAGYPLEWLGYRGFFTWVMIATIPSFVVTALVAGRVDAGFGLAEAETDEAPQEIETT
jgi:MFS transporter, PAT family, beta-lactamase induction signal transducer AmpG